MLTVNLAPVKYPKYAHDESPVYLTGMVDWKLSVRPHTWRPPTDIYESENRYVVRVEIGGMKESEFAVTVDDNTITIQGARTDTTERRAYHQMEIHYGEFSIEIEFPGSIDVAGVEAGYDDGFLKVSLPKSQPHQVEIQE